MSVELNKKLCGWLLDWNTSDGVFGHCFLVLTWNLSCHTHKTTNIQLCEIEWSSTFDAFEIYFAHMKMDQTGDEAKYSCHLYCSPCCPLICPVLALAFYFSCCCNLGRELLPTCCPFLVVHQFHTMGTVKDVYMWYLSSGDQFVGHCLAMLPLLQMEFASSSPPPPPPPKFFSSVE